SKMTVQSYSSTTLKCLALGCPVFVFFFQAEDGIRDATVTGVQTCALPISFRSSPSKWPEVFLRNPSLLNSRPVISSISYFRHARSEERRVGKECRYRWSQ